MQVAKWGNSLAVRIPADVARELNLKEGDDIHLRALPDEEVFAVVSEVQRHEAARRRLRELRFALPADYKFDREEANAR